ncbi:MAG TPA: B12-binding domain-containing protein [Conexivisphaerales archaeon]|nr:B12-binding domain-containing protein [Conexivisphaerales archaeon]
MKGEPVSYKDDYLKAVLDRDRKRAGSVVESMLDKGERLLPIMETLGEAQVRIGELWAEKEISVADEHFATATTMEMIEKAARRLRAQAGVRKGSAVLLNCVEGEFHYVGLKMFSALLSSEGWDVEFIERGASLNRVFEYLRGLGRRFDIVCLTMTMGYNEESLIKTLRALRADTLFRDSVIIVGSRLLKSKRVKEAVTGKASGERLADYCSLSLKDGLGFVNGLKRGA